MNSMEAPNNEVVSSSNIESIKNNYEELYADWRRQYHIFSKQVNEKNFPLPENNEEENVELMGKISALKEKMNNEGISDDTIQEMNDIIDERVKNEVYN